MSYFSDTLRTAYEKKGLSYEQLSKLCDVSRPTFQRYVTGKTAKLDISKIVSICNVLEVDVHKLIGYDKNSPFIEINKNFGQLLKRSRDDFGKSQQQMADMLQIPLELYLAYENGERFPDFATASAWAISLGISPEEYDPLYNSGQQAEKELDAELIQIAKQLSPAQVEQTKAYMRGMLDNPSDKK